MAPDARPRETGHDIIVIGASAGGLAPLKRLLSELPADLPASVFVVMHVGEHISMLDQVLRRTATLGIAHAKNGETAQRGRVYIAPADRHLLLHDGHILLRRGAHENMSRPAIDPLFRTAACSFGARVIGVVLSGSLNDGTAGLLAIKRCGGITVVQDPNDAEIAEMPRSALANVDIDYSVPAAELADLLVRLVHKPAGATPPIPLTIRLEAAIAVQENSGMKGREGDSPIERMDRIGNPSHFTCPQCQGTLWEIGDGSLLRYRCHVGHAFTGDVMLTAQAKEMEDILWRLIRSHEERSEFAFRLGAHERGLQREGLARTLETRGRRYAENAEMLRRMVVDPESEENLHLTASEADGEKEEEPSGE